MNVWAVVLYVLEVFTLLGALAGLSRVGKGKITLGNGANVFALCLTALGFVAIYRLTQQSSAEHAVALGITYAVVCALALPHFFATWVRGSVTYTRRRALLVTLAGVTGIILTSILAFAG